MVAGFDAAAAVLLLVIMSILKGGNDPIIAMRVYAAGSCAQESEAYAQFDQEVTCKTGQGDVCCSRRASVEIVGAENARETLAGNMDMLDQSARDGEASRQTGKCVSRSRGNVDACLARTGLAPVCQRVSAMLQAVVKIWAILWAEGFASLTFFATLYVLCIGTALVSACVLQVVACVAFKSCVLSLCFFMAVLYGTCAANAWPPRSSSCRDLPLCSVWDMQCGCM